MERFFGEKMRIPPSSCAATATTDAALESLRGNRPSNSMRDPPLKAAVHIAYHTDKSIAMDGPYVYLIVEREFINARVPVVKIGKSDEVGRRVKDYPKGSLTLSICPVQSAKMAEDALKAAFGAVFQQRRDIGIEYFQPTGEYESACDAARHLHHAVCNQHVRYEPLAISAPEHQDSEACTESTDANECASTSTTAPHTSKTCDEVLTSYMREVHGGAVPERGLFLDKLVSDMTEFCSRNEWHCDRLRSRSVAQRLIRQYNCRVQEGTVLPAATQDDVIRFASQCITPSTGSHFTLRAAATAFHEMTGLPAPPCFREYLERALGPDSCVACHNTNDGKAHINAVVNYQLRRYPSTADEQPDKPVGHSVSLVKQFLSLRDDDYVPDGIRRPVRRTGYTVSFKALQTAFRAYVVSLPLEQREHADNVAFDVAAVEAAGFTIDKVNCCCACSRRTPRVVKCCPLYDNKLRVKLRAVIDMDLVSLDQGKDDELMADAE